MRQSRDDAMSEEDLELRAAGFAAMLGIAGVVILVALVVVGLVLA